MTATASPDRTNTTARYASCIEASKRIRWDIDRDVFRGRRLDFTKKFLPEGLTKARELPFLDAGGQRLLSQIQGRTYANMFGLVERFIGAKMLEVSRDHWLGDQTALEALVRFTDEELKHQELFRRLEVMTAAGMTPGYAFASQPNDVARAVLGKSTWAVLGLTCSIELLTLAHYRQSIEPDAELSELWKDVFTFHWREESQHAILDELEWVRVDRALSAGERDRAVTDLADLVGAVDGILRAQAAADAAYFAAACGRKLRDRETQAVQTTVLRAYRWQYIGSGVTDERFQKILRRMIDERQMARLGEALAPILQ
ncbi:MAG TPA: hypothetical protein VFA35_00960 [Burkholderiaceae bacterium]|nr:hypothetical protein [Burkholderiaceae bacterium]